MLTDWKFEGRIITDREDGACVLLSSIGKILDEVDPVVEGEDVPEVEEEFNANVNTETIAQLEDEAAANRAALVDDDANHVLDDALDEPTVDG